MATSKLYQFQFCIVLTCLTLSVFLIYQLHPQMQNLKIIFTQNNSINMALPTDAPPSWENKSSISDKQGKFNTPTSSSGSVQWHTTKSLLGRTKNCGTYFNTFPVISSLNDFVTFEEKEMSKSSRYGFPRFLLRFHGY